MTLAKRDQPALPGFLLIFACESARQWATFDKPSVIINLLSPAPTNGRRKVGAQRTQRVVCCSRPLPCGARLGHTKKRPSMAHISRRTCFFPSTIHFSVSILSSHKSDNKLKQRWCGIAGCCIRSLSFWPRWRNIAYDKFLMVSRRVLCARIYTSRRQGLREHQPWLGSNSRPPPCITQHLTETSCRKVERRWCPFLCGVPSSMMQSTDSKPVLWGGGEGLDSVIWLMIVSLFPNLLLIHRSPGITYVGVVCRRSTRLEVLFQVSIAVAPEAQKLDFKVCECRFDPNSGW